MANENVDYHKVVGEPFDPWVNSEILNRQSIYSSGFNSNRSPKQLSYLNGRNSWVKFGSGCNVIDQERLRNQLNITNPSAYDQAALAQSFVLFNGLNATGVAQREATANEVPYTQVDELRGFQNQRRGVAQSNSLINNSVYGFGGTEFGIQPSPGIIDFEVNHLNRGSVRIANIRLKAYNKFQFDLIDLLYLRLGFSAMIEFGHSHYLNSEGTPTPVSTTLLDHGSGFWSNTGGFGTPLSVLSKIRTKAQEYHGSYDAIFGKISNFNWEFADDGTYNIEVSITSLGDVTESLKINTLPSNNIITPTLDEQLEEDSDENINKNAIINWFYCLKKLEAEEKKAFFDNNSRDFAYYSPDITGPSLGGTPTATNQWQTKHYVRLGRFFEWLEENVFCHFETVTGQSYPIISIDYSEYPLCNNQTNPDHPLFSFNPEICLINNDFKSSLENRGVGNLEYINWIDRRLQSFSALNGTRGIINSIYLEFDFLQGLLEQNIDTENDGKVTLYVLLNEICKGINFSLGNVVELEPTIDEERNTIVIRDQKVAPSRTNPARSIPKPPPSTPIEIYGIHSRGDRTQSSFVRNFSFNTAITNALATQISIGASANNETVAEEATSFQKWNIGLLDRFKEKSKDGKENLSEAESQFSCGPETKETSFNLDGLGTFLLYNTNIGRIYLDLKAYARESKKRQIEKRRQQRNSYLYNLILAFGATTRNFKAKNPNYDSNLFPSRLFTHTKGSYFTEEFFKINETLKNIYINQFNLEQNSKEPDPKLTNSNNIGFIPVELSLTLDGISGVRIYNSINVHTDVLPSNYPSALEFIVKTVGHRVENNNWTTVITAIAKPKAVENQETEDAVS